ncbi:MAG: L-ribulose-5-phosphate 4-epimerase [Prevotella sp.]|nr:L-ribulose-5-phosphate 4-epimerase [Prevotella sp.]
MLEELKEKVFRANLDLVKHNLVIFTWGNVSAIDRESGLVVIKPSGVEYDVMKPSDMVVVELATGKVVEGDLNPSSDTPTHLVLYKAFPEIGGIVHTHSTYATAWAQAGKDIPNIGTTHADYFHDGIPCTSDMTADQMDEYEYNTGVVIVNHIVSGNINPIHTPAVLVKNHGPFAWGKDADQAVYHAVVTEEVAKMAFISFMVNPETTMNPLLIEKHFSRKHGPNAYYGQKKK